jgi:hypothetical protein
MASAGAAILGARGSTAGIIVGGLFGAMLVVSAGISTRRSLGRRRTVAIAVTAGAIEVDGVHVAARRAPEEIVVLKVGGGRGEYPLWALAYDTPTSRTHLATWMSFAGPHELAPFVQRVQGALAAHPVGNVR